MVNRRAFLRSLLALPIAATLDVEKLLWIPGQMVTVPAMPAPLVSAGHIRQLQREYNYYQSQMAELVALAPKAPWMTGQATISAHINALLWEEAKWQG